MSSWCSSSRSLALALFAVIALPSTRSAAQTVIDADTTWSTDQAFSGTLTINAGVTVTIDGNVQVSADSLVVAPGARVTATGKGYAAATGPGAGVSDGDDGGPGGGHGGQGAYGAGSTLTAPGARNDAPLAPADKGSGGGNGCNSTTGGAGGGAIRFVVVGSCSVDGIVDADGLAGSANGACGGGGGAGGAISFSCGSFGGEGAVHANGGDGGALGGTDRGGGGGGGRVLIASDVIDVDGVALAAAAGSDAGVGSVALFGPTAGDVHAIGGFDFRAADAPHAFGSFLADGASVLVEAAVTSIAVGAGFVLDAATLSTSGELSVDATGGSFEMRGSTVYADRLEIVAATVDVDIESEIDASGRGAAQNSGSAPGGAATLGGGGGGHGGSGGAGENGGGGGAAYGLAFAPALYGSGGGTGNNGGAPGGSGGGIIVISAADDVVLDGLLRVDGTDGGTSSDRGGGGGAGGSIHVMCASLSGIGEVSARGGRGGAQNWEGGGGGGGRVLLHCDDFAGFVWPDDGAVAGGLGNVAGARGSLALYSDVDDALVVRGGFDFFASEGPHQYASLDGSGAMRLGAGTTALDVTGDATLRGSVNAATDMTLTVGGQLALVGATLYGDVLTVTAGSASVDMASALSASGRGFPSAQGPGAGVSTSNYESGGGAGHGGVGATAPYGFGGGPIYGDALAPSTKGSGGGTGHYGNAPGGRGGGVVRLDVAGALVLDGALYANGANGGQSGDRGGGGGSGGSIFVTCESLSGRGLAQAKGGNGGPASSRHGGDGGGGRISFVYESGGLLEPRSSSSATGTLVPGERGTAVFHRTSTNDLFVVHGLDLDDAAGPFAFRDLTLYQARLKLDGATTGLALALAGDLVGEDGTLVVTGSAGLDVAGDAVFSGGGASGGDLALSTSNLTTAGATFALSRLDVDASATIALDDTTLIDGRGRGYAAGTGPGAGVNAGDRGGGGAGHGGAGGASDPSCCSGTYGSPGPEHGTAYEPTDKGSGGGHGRSGAAPGGAGGGAVRLFATGAIVVDGNVMVDGAGGGSESNRGGGGGAGGSIWLRAPSVSGLSTLYARGGLGGGCCSVGAGGGGGGRILVEAALVDLPRRALWSAAGGGGYNSGATGTAAILYDDGALEVLEGWLFDAAHANDGAGAFEYTSITVAAGALMRAAADVTRVAATGAIVDGGAAWRQADGLELAGSTLRFSSADVLASAALTLDAAARVELYGTLLRSAALTVRAPVVIVDSAAALDASARGFAAEQGPGAGSHGGDRGGAGGSHGGSGAYADSCCSGPVSVPGAVNGDALAPTTRGSGGGSIEVSNNPGLLTVGGTGGGVIRVEATTSLTHHGEMRANGGSSQERSSRSGGGGAGGSVWVTAGRLDGAGRFYALGGASPGCCSVQGGGGGGGRVLVEYDEGGIDDATASSVDGGAGYGGLAQQGSLAFVHRGDGRLVVVGGLDLDESLSYQAVTLAPQSELRIGGGAPVVLDVTGAVTLSSAALRSSVDLTIHAGAFSLLSSTVDGSAALSLHAPGGAVSLGSSIIGAQDLEVTAQTLTVDGSSRLHADAKGALPEQGDSPGTTDVSDCGGGGGGHGGAGGYAYQGCAIPGGVEYGDPFEPVSWGSGGGLGRNRQAPAGRGGGAVRIDVSETMALSGSVSAAGSNGGTSADRGGGGGAGGSIWVTTKALAGGGAFRAPGGNGYGNYRAGGGGAGGRVAVYFDESTFAGFSKTAVGGGSSPSQAGEAGSALFIDRATADLVIAGGMTFRADDGPFRYRDVSTTPGSLVRARGETVRLEASGSVALDATTWRASDGLELLADLLSLEGTSTISAKEMTLSAGDVVVGASSVIDVSGGGEPASEGPGAGNDEAGDRGGGGAGHGGKGGNGNWSAGGARYGSDDLTDPLAGSGGGHGWGANAPGGAGGGVLRVFAARELVLDGTVRADGRSGSEYQSRGGGGGSGGSVRLEGESFSGTGTISARGGNGGGTNVYQGGGGGGGRVALCYTSGRMDALTALTVGGGSGYYNGEGGTFYLDDDCNRAPSVVSLFVEQGGVALPAGALLPAGYAAALVALVADDNGPADIDVVRVAPLGAAGPTFSWTRATGAFAGDGEEDEVALSPGESSASLDGAGFVVRFAFVPSFAFEGESAVPTVTVDDEAGFTTSGAVAEAAFAVATSLRVSRRSFVVGERELLAGDWLTSDAALRAIGRVTYAGLNRGPPASAGIEAEVRSAAGVSLASDALAADGSFDLDVDAPSGDSTLSVRLLPSSLPVGATEVDALAGVALRVDGTDPVVSSVTLDPPRLAASYVGPVRVTVTVTDAQSGVGLAAQRIDVRLGDGGYDGDELMAPLGGGAFGYELGDRSFAPFSGSALAYRITASDVAGNTVVVEGERAIEAQNQPPALTNAPPPTAVEGQPWSWTVAADDPEDDPLRYLLLGAPPGMAVAGDTVTWVPSFDQVGEESATLRVLDALGAYVDHAFTVSVAPLDEDGDGMADTWERVVGLNPQIDDAGGDADGDQRSNLSEFLEGTDPVSNRAPGVPALLAPADGAVVDTARPVLRFGIASDPEGDVLSYAIELYGDAALSTLLASAAGLSDDGTAVRFVPGIDLPEDAAVYWRARAFDGVKHGGYSDVGRFGVDAENGAPGVARTLSPLDGGVVSTTSAPLLASLAFDPEGDPLSYELEIYSDAALTALFATRAASVDGNLARATVDGLVDGASYWWRARATDEPGAEGPFSAAASFTVDLSLENTAPSAPRQLSPIDDVVVIEAEAPLVAENAVDDEGDRLVYRFELDESDCFCTAALVVALDVAEGVSGLTRYFASGLEHTSSYAWRVRAEDGAAAGPWSESAFRVTLDNQPPTTPRVHAPADGGEGSADGQRLAWVRSFDLEGGALGYDVELLDVTAGEPVTVAVVGGSDGGSDELASWDPATGLVPGHVYAWRVRAVDDEGASSAWSDVANFSVYAASTLNRAPVGLALLSPVDGALVATKTPALEVKNAVDPDGEELRYSFELYADAELQDLVLAAEVGEGAGGSTRLQLEEPLVEGETYYWRASVTDGFAAVPFTPAERFTVRLFGAPPDDEEGLPDAGPLPGEDGGPIEPVPPGCPCAQAKGGADAGLVALAAFLLALASRRRRRS